MLCRLALDDMEAALALEPTDKNAEKYKALIQSRLASTSEPTTQPSKGSRREVLEYKQGKPSAQRLSASFHFVLHILGHSDLGGAS